MIYSKAYHFKSVIFRTFKSDKYWFGFNRKEKNEEVKGSGNQKHYRLITYDIRICKFLYLDPLTKNFPWYTSFQFTASKPRRRIRLIILLLMLINVYSCDYSEIKKHPAITNGKIIDYDNVYNSPSFYPVYEFYVEGVKYTNSSCTRFYLKYWDLFNGKTFPVIYSKLKPDCNDILLLPEDFKRFNLGNYPDSLNWVLKTE
jgi:hypothetical protein